ISGARQSVSGVANDGRETEVCNLWYPILLDKVLRAAPWPSARMARRLGLIKEKADGTQWENGDPHPGYRFAYSYPEDMVRPRYLSNYAPFITGMLTAGTPAIMTNAEAPILIYTMRQKQQNQ